MFDSTLFFCITQVFFLCLSFNNSCKGVFGSAAYYVIQESYLIFNTTLYKILFYPFIGSPSLVLYSSVTPMFTVILSFQAIQNPNDIQLQEKAWNSVCPLVVRLKRFYEFSLRLGKLVYLFYFIVFICKHTKIIWKANSRVIKHSASNLPTIPEFLSLKPGDCLGYMIWTFSNLKFWKQSTLKPCTSSVIPGSPQVYLLSGQVSSLI